MSRRILITGGYGYIGGRVAQALVAGGAQVLLGTRRDGSVAPVWLPQAAPVQMDWSSDEALLAACTGVDAVVHLAALNEVEAVRDPQGALDVNGMWSLRLLEAAQAAGAGRFVYLSTAHVYGAPLSGTIDESCLPRPVHPYAITHRVAEDFVLAARDAGKIEGVVLRLSNGFGAPAHAGVDRWTLLVNDLCRQAVNTHTLVLHSAGLQKRDFITLNDVARGVVHALGLADEALGDGLFNLGGDASLRVIDMAELIAARCEAVLGFIPEINSPDPKPGEVSAELAYSSEKFKRTAWAPGKGHADEIDATLTLCQQIASRSSVSVSSRM